MIKTIKTYAWATAVLLGLASVAVRRIALDLKQYMDSLKHPGVAYPSLCEFSFSITPWLGILPLALGCFLGIAHFRKVSDKAIVHAWGSTCLIFLAGLLLAFLAYTIPWVPKISEMQP